MILRKRKMHRVLKATGFKSSTYSLAHGDKVEYGRNKWGEHFAARKRGKKVYIRAI